MNDERDRIIDRYTSGRMSPSEEGDFNKLLELDGDLNRMLRAEKFVDGTIRRDRSKLESRDHSRTYAGFLGTLATSVAGQSRPLLTQAATAASGGLHPMLQCALSLLILLGTTASLLVIHEVTSDRPGVVVQGDRATGRGGEGETGRQGEGIGEEGVKEGKGDAVMGREERKELEGKTEPEVTREQERVMGRGGERMKQQAPLFVRDTVVSRNVPSRPEDVPVFEDDTLRTRLNISPAE